MYCFYPLAIMNTASINMGIKISVQLTLFISFGYRFGSKIARSYGNSMFYHFEKMPNCFPQWLQHFIFPRAKHKVLISPHPHKHLLSIFLIIHICISSTAITRYHRLGGLNNRNFYSHSPRGLKSKIIVQELLVSREDQGAWWATIHGVAKSQTRLSNLCVCVEVVCRGPAPADPGYSKERRHRRGSGNNCLITR